MSEDMLWLGTLILIALVVFIDRLRFWWWCRQRPHYSTTRPEYWRKAQP